jgi:YcxB-like protein
MTDAPLATYEFALDADDYVAFAMFAATRSRFRRRVGRLMALFAIGPLAVALDLALGIHPDLYEEAGGIPGLIVLALAIGGFLIAFGWLTDPVRIRFEARRRFRDGSFAAFTKPQMIEISAEGMRFSGGASQGLTPWSAVVAIEEGTKAAYFFVNSLSAHIVPRRAFADVASFKHFLAHARALHDARLGM